MPFFSFNSSYSLNKFLLILLSFLIYSCSAPRYVNKDETTVKLNAPLVRILLNEPASSVQFTSGEDIYVYSGEQKLMTTIKKGTLLSFREKKGLSLETNRNNYKAEYFSIRTDKNFSYNNKKLNGIIKIVSDGEMVYLINSLSIEEYLKGVIPSEMPLGTGTEYFEALKAFAICARTFTLQRIASGNKIYDVRTDVRDQVYGGAARQYEISNLAVDETKGMILTYDSKPAQVFYSSTCGGRTEDIENVFGPVKYSYLQSIDDGNEPFCSASPRFKWEETFSAERIANLLKQSGKLKESGYTISDIKINSRFRSGRINELEISAEKDGIKIPVKLFGNNIRFVLLTSDNQVLNSNKFEIFKKGNTYFFKGTGWGHGVGLCQWGALIQSVRGYDSSEILKHYFPGTLISSYYD